MQGILFFLSFINTLYCQVVVIDYKGDVFWRKDSLAQWEILPQSSFTIPQGGAIKLDKESWAKILVNNKIKIHAYGSTAIEMESISLFYVSLGLVYGKIDIDVDLPLSSLLVIKTLNSTYSTKKMIASIWSDIEGKTGISIIRGEADFEYLIPHKSGKRNFKISQGTRFRVEGSEKPYEFKLIGIDEEQSIFVYKDQESKFSKLSFVNKYMQSIAQKYTNDAVREKNYDYEAGKTLKDIHGNTVRVEQRILRPYENQIQFVNITKRHYYSDYSYSSDYSKNIDGFRYNGGEKNQRIDLFTITFSFNQNLPKNIENLPSFFSNPSVNPQWATFVTASLHQESISLVGKAYKYIQERGELINNTEVVGVPQNLNERDKEVIIIGDNVSKDVLNDIINYNFKEKNTTDPTGNLIRKSDENDIPNVLWGLKSSDERIDGNIYTLKKIRYSKGGKGEDFFWLTSEDYLISDLGKIRNKDEIEKNFSNVNELFEKNAINSIIYIKKDSNGYVSNEDYFSSKNNIDLVIPGRIILKSFENLFDGIKRWRD